MYHSIGNQEPVFLDFISHKVEFLKYTLWAIMLRQQAGQFQLVNFIEVFIS